MMSRKEELENKYLEFLEYLDSRPGDEIPQVLEEIEVLVCSLISDRPYLQKKYQKNRDKVEQRVLAKITGDPVNIADLLDDLGKRVSEILKRSPEEIDRELGIFVNKLSGVILPPGEVRMQEGIGVSQEREHKELREFRYGKILEILRENEIYADDIIVYTAGLNANQKRQTSYRVIQIPRISKTIFVCDEYGEASFIVDSLVYPEVFLKSTKSDIREALEAERIVHNDGWEDKIIESIFGKKNVVEENSEVFKQKIDVRKMEEYRQEILKIFPTPEDWIGCLVREMKKIIVYEKGFVGVASLFGVKGDPISNRGIRAKLGQKIYGKHEVFNRYLREKNTKHWTQEKWKREVLLKYPTPESWMSLSAKEKGKLKIHGKGIVSLSTVFGIKGDPAGNNRIMAELGQQIYGRHEILDEYLKEDITKDWTQTRWKGEILKVLLSAESWMGLSYDDRKALKIHGKGIVSLSTVFGIKGDPTGNNAAFAELGQKIYGKHEVFDKYLQEDITKDWTHERWKQEILEFFPTPKAWMSMTHNEKNKLRIQRKTLRVISTIFGIEGDPASSTKIFAQLGQKIYGKHEVFDKYLQEDITKDWTHERWKQEILQQFPTAKTWMSLTAKAKGQLRIHEKGLAALATIFEVEGNPVGYRGVMAKLGQEIYGEQEIFKEYIEAYTTKDWPLQRWRQEISKKLPTPESWIGMSREERYKFKNNGKGLGAICTIFKLKGDPIGNSMTFAMLGQKIYGKSSIFEEYLKEDITKDWTQERWMQEIKQYYPTPESWIGMDSITRVTFKIHGMRFEAISTKFGIKGNPSRNLQAMAQFGQKIYGDDKIFDEYIEE